MSGILLIKSIQSYWDLNVFVGVWDLNVFVGVWDLNVIALLSCFLNLHCDINQRCLYSVVLTFVIMKEPATFVLMYLDR